MMDLIIVEFIGFILVVVGIWMIQREKKLFEESDIVLATVVDYAETYEKNRMFTMIVSYQDHNNVMIRSSERRSSNRKKYDIGDQIHVKYSMSQPDIFIRCNDITRMVAFTGMIVIGLSMMIGLGYVLFKNI